MRLVCCLSLVLGACTPTLADDPGESSAANTAASACQVHVGLPSCGLSAAGFEGDARRRAEQLTSLFENRTTELRYDYIDALGDGRGYTAGRAGFTTGTGDLLMVAERYTNLVPDNALAPYLPRLRELAQVESASITGLSGFPDAWRTTAADPQQRAVQDAVVDETYFQPAMAAAGCVGATLPLSLAFLYDTIIQHGGGDDADSLGSILARAQRTAGGTPADGIDEVVWLRALMNERRRDLAHACAASTRHEWAQSVDRVDVMIGLLQAGELMLDGPLSVTLDGDHYAID